MEALDNNPFINNGMYSPSNIAFLLRLKSPTKIINWLYGYKRNGKQYPSLHQSSYTEIISDESVKLASFRDLIELLAINTFKTAGVSHNKIRVIKQRLGNEFNTNYPFTDLRLRTDGKEIYLKITKDTLRDAASNQYSPLELLEQSLINVEFADNQPSQWWILGKDSHILIDPKRSFGNPIESETGIPTETLLAYSQAKGETIASTAQAFMATEEQVIRAIKFHEMWAA